MITQWLAELSLSGLSPAAAQTSGEAVMLPLVADAPLSQALAAPETLTVGRNQRYGQLVFVNPSPTPSLVPAHLAVLTSEAAQDHAMAHAGLLRPREKRAYDTAACIEQAQSGYMSGDHTECQILPLGLRVALNNPASGLRHKESFDKLWPEIRRHNLSSDLSRVRAHLSDFYHAPEVSEALDRFALSFEPLEGQLGAVFFIGGEPAGLEVMPTFEHWRHYWKALVRGCYGSEVVRRRAKAAAPPPWRLRYPTGIYGSVYQTLTEFEEQFSRTLAAELTSRHRWYPYVSVSERIETRGEPLHHVECRTGTRVGDLLIEGDARCIYASVPLGAYPW